MSVDWNGRLERDFTAFAEEAWPQLVRGAVLMGASQHNAEDAVQSVLSRCYMRWRKVDRMADRPIAYAFRALRNELSRSTSRRDIPTDPHELSTNLEREAPNSDELVPPDPVPLRTAIVDLPQHQREVIVCAFYLEFTDRETAAALDIPVGTVKSRKARALDAIAVRLQTAPAGMQTPQHK